MAIVTTASVMFQSTPPAEARGDIAFMFVIRSPSKFQSTPPAEARGDVRSVTGGIGEGRFNPLPPPKRGETWAASEAERKQKVSIHSRPVPKLGPFEIDHKSAA